ncbi:hypothetical protein AWZ03_010771 [Drosophila navojoa]|uniref:Uncharacterized protein n=1 Tax=Drosophila navojoa TaxID=7232 RepID=A0A484B1W3_DRONA|nr:hypothetical protein AWZ03_010771 [Drosophila navojoa]
MHVADARKSIKGSSLFRIELLFSFRSFDFTGVGNGNGNSNSNSNGNSSSSEDRVRKQTHAKVNFTPYCRHFFRSAADSRKPSRALANCLCCDFVDTAAAAAAMAVEVLAAAAVAAGVAAAGSAAVSSDAASLLPCHAHTHTLCCLLPGAVHCCAFTAASSYCPHLANTSFRPPAVDRL